MIRLEIILLWTAVAFYALSTSVFIYGVAFAKPKRFSWAIALMVTGMLIQGVEIGVRWWESGHGPYYQRFEVYSFFAWVNLLFYLFLQKRMPSTRALGTFIVPAAFLLAGGALMSSPVIREVPVTFKTFWLILHIYFAKISYGSCSLATFCGVAYLLKNGRRKGHFISSLIRMLPEPEILDDLSYRLTTFGFIAIGVMIAAGAIWANNAWGTYWGWDPVETWSLISWVLYGIYLHLRRMHGLRGKFAAIYSIAAFLVLVFALLGVGLVYISSHSPYLN